MTKTEARLVRGGHQDVYAVSGWSHGPKDGVIGGNDWVHPNELISADFDFWNNKSGLFGAGPSQSQQQFTKQGSLSDPDARSWSDFVDNMSQDSAGFFTASDPTPLQSSGQPQGEGVSTGQTQRLWNEWFQSSKMSYGYFPERPWSYELPS
jgi:hypothetical protein